MTRTITRTLSVLALVATATAARADDKTLFERRAALEPAKQRGTVAALGKRTVQVHGQGKVTIKRLAEKVFADQAAFTADLGRAKGALFGAAVVDDEVIETANATVLRMTTRFTVADAGKLRAAAPRLRGYGDAGAPVTAASLTAAQRAGFDAFKRDLATRPTGHPLRAALAQGDDALLAAIAAGLGDVEVTTSITVPTRGLSRGPDGRFSSPARADDLFDLTRLAPSTTLTAPTPTAAKATAVTVGVTDAIKPGAGAATLPDPLPHDGSGIDARTWSMLAGDTQGSLFEWEKTWKFPSGYFKASAHAEYVVGLRIPIEVTATVKPTVRTSTAIVDEASSYSVALSARAFDAVGKFYQNTGLPPELVYDGKELVLQLEAWAKVELSAGWGAIELSEKFPKNLKLDKSRDFTPPFGDCGTRCGFDLWLPSKVTRTELDLKLVKVGAELGFLVGGQGKIGLRYTSLYQGETPSQLGSKTADHHDLVFAREASQTVTTKLPRMTAPGAASYGYQLDQLDYDWKVELTPGVRVNVTVNAKPFFKIEETIGPLWLSFIEIPLATFDFDAHPGTRSEVSHTPGQKYFAPAPR